MEDLFLHVFLDAHEPTLGAAALCGDKTKSEESRRRMGGKRVH